MPAKFRIKEYKPEAIYYIYSTGFEGRNVFEDEVDYDCWLNLMERYCGGLVEKRNLRYKPDRPYRLKKKMEMALFGESKILAYCLLRQKVHLLVWQKNPDGITKLMRRILTNFTMYMNRRHRRKGKLFSGVYKGVMVSDGEKLVHLSRFIHLLPKTKSVKRFGLVETISEFNPEEYLYSSFSKYINVEQNEWFDATLVLQEFEKLKVSSNRTYKEFVEDNSISGESDKLVSGVVF